MHRTALVWFRRDLRLTDNSALACALGQADRVVPVFIFAPAEEQQWSPRAASRWWLHHKPGGTGRRTKKARQSAHYSTRAVVACIAPNLAGNRGDAGVLEQTLRSRRIEARCRRRRPLERDDVTVEQCNSALLFPPGAILNGQQLPYRVFTPFWRTVEKELTTLPAPVKAPRKLPSVKRNLTRVSLDELQLRPKIAWDDGIAQAWRPGENGALRQFKRFGKHIAAYPLGRDRPDSSQTSRLSPHLHFGEIGPRQIVAALRHPAANDEPGNAAHAKGADSFLRQIGWREFAHHLLFHFPATTDRPLDPRFANQRWDRSRANLRAWQRGVTGIPIVDAGMRELWRTGWMHNRVRMIAASLLTKNLQIDWLTGARWFWDTLVDADLANNTLGWQWTAGCGADAAPYYRIFNPVLQAERFDPQRRYIRQWLPEIARLPDRWIHQPWAAPEEILHPAGVRLGITYPYPVVDLGESRKRALQAYSELSRL